MPGVARTIPIGAGHEAEVVHAAARGDDRVRRDPVHHGLEDHVGRAEACGSTLHLLGVPRLCVAEGDIEHLLAGLELEVTDPERPAVEQRIAVPVGVPHVAPSLVPNDRSLARLRELRHRGLDLGALDIEELDVRVDGHTDGGMGDAGARWSRVREVLGAHAGSHGVGRTADHEDAERDQENGG